jgi:hypothetical protein
MQRLVQQKARKEGLHMRSTIRSYLLAILAIAPLCLAQGSQAYATPVLVTNMNGDATGILNLVVGSTTYNIDFVEGTFNDVYSGTVFADAFDINNAINPILNGDGGPYDLAFDTVGYTDSYFVPLSVAASDVTTRFSQIDFGWQTQPITSTHSTTEVVGWASPSVVPLPAALPLFSGALGVLGLLGWRRRQTAAAAA